MRKPSVLPIIGLTCRSPPQLQLPWRMDKQTWFNLAIGLCFPSFLPCPMAIAIAICHMYWCIVAMNAVSVYDYRLLKYNNEVTSVVPIPSIHSDSTTMRGSLQFSMAIFETCVRVGALPKKPFICVCIRIMCLHPHNWLFLANLYSSSDSVSSQEYFSVSQSF